MIAFLIFVFDIFHRKERVNKINNMLFLLKFIIKGYHMKYVLIGYS